MKNSREASENAIMQRKTEVDQYVEDLNQLIPDNQNVDEEFVDYFANENSN
jgi:hypothetical protein